MKKKTLAIVLVVCLLATALVSGTLAYFQDSQKATNVFTVGNVKIWLAESFYQREGWYADEDLPQGFEPAVNGVAFTNEKIIESAAVYHDYLEGKQLMPGIKYNKMPYVLNTGNSDAYIRIRVMIPTTLNADYLNSSVICTTALTSGEFKRPAGVGNYDVDGTKTVDDVQYDVYTFIRNEALEVGEMTYWNVWNTIKMDDDVTTAELESALEAGYIAEDGTFKVLVEADAIQAAGFADVDAAFAAFVAQQN